MSGKKQEHKNEPRKFMQNDVAEEENISQVCEESGINPLQEQLDAQKDKYIRLMAEFDNFKKRTANEYLKMVGSANKALIDDLIEVREIFERALAADIQIDADAFKNGVQMIYNKFDEILTKHGLESFGEVGEKFDPALHDAMMKQPSAEIPQEHILTIFEKGYKLKDNIIRHAKVVVSAGN